MDRYLAAAVQMNSGQDKARNLERATELVEQAVRRGAQLVALPELFNCLTQPEVIVEQAEPIPGPTSRAMSELAARLQITLVAGSMAERVAHSPKVYNSSLLFSPTGEQLACYRKVHLFDIDLPGRVTFQESHFMAVGETVQANRTPVGKIGQSICYDLRFPELYRRLMDQGAELFVVPAAFTQATGRDHWEVLLRARAIENQVYVIAPNQYGQHTATLTTYGRSQIVDPWGTVLATAGDGEGIVVAEIDNRRQAEIRTHLPAWKHRRL